LREHVDQLNGALLQSISKRTPKRRKADKAEKDRTNKQQDDRKSILLRKRYRKRKEDPVERKKDEVRVQP